ncbi:MAG: ribbon-helix-helix domain-containing protein, partial [Candidatus Puniceispirillaceae bacterium]
MLKKNIIIAHRRTSLALEVYFWDCL